jgi:hypothetical protein
VWCSGVDEVLVEFALVFENFNYFRGQVHKGRHVTEAGVKDDWVEKSFISLH